MIDVAAPSLPQVAPPPTRAGASRQRRAGHVRPGAFAVSLGLHAAGIAAALALGVAHGAAANWAASAAAPRLPLLVDSRVPLHEPAALPCPPVVAEWSPPEPTLDDVEVTVPPVEPDAEAPTPDRELPLRPSHLPDDWLRPLRPPAAPADAPAPQPPAATTTTSDPGAFVEATPVAGANEPPAYPFAAWRNGIEGVVVVILEIDAAGVVSAAHVERSSGNGQLDDAALQKLSRWRFAPASRGGVAVRSTFRQEVVFRLR